MNICCKAGLVVLHSSSFCLSVKSLISLSSLFKLSFKIAYRKLRTARPKEKEMGKYYFKACKINKKAV